MIFDRHESPLFKDAIEKMREIVKSAELKPGRKRMRGGRGQE
jgi:hypothetical protein